MTKLDYTACRNVIAAILHQAIKDAAYGLPAEKELAHFWIAGPNSKHLTEMMGILKWPPDKACYDHERQEYLKRRAAHMERKAWSL